MKKNIKKIIKIKLGVACGASRLGVYVLNEANPQTIAHWAIFPPFQGFLLTPKKSPPKLEIKYLSPTKTKTTLFGTKISWENLVQLYGQWNKKRSASPLRADEKVRRLIMPSHEKKVTVEKIFKWKNQKKPPKKTTLAPTHKNQNQNKKKTEKSQRKKNLNFPQENPVSKIYQTNLCPEALHSPWTLPSAGGQTQHHLAPKTSKRQMPI